MTVQKLTISVQPDTIKQFKKLAKIKGYSISSWVNAKMDEELEKTNLIKQREIFDLLNKLRDEELEEIYSLYL